MTGFETLIQSLADAANGLAGAVKAGLGALPPEIVAAGAAVAALFSYASVAFGWWKQLRNLWLRIFDPEKLKAQQPVTGADLKKAIEELKQAINGSNWPEAQKNQTVRQLEKAGQSQAPEDRQAVAELAANEPERAYGTLMAAAQRRKAAMDVGGAIESYLSAAAFVAASDPAKAANAYGEALALKPDLFAANIALAYHWLAAGNGAKAMDYADKAASSARGDSETAYARIALAHVNLRAGNSERALSLLRDSLKLLRAMRDAQPDDELTSRRLGEALQLLGDAYTVAGDLDDARALYRQSHDIRLDLCRRQPNNGDYLRELIRSISGMAASLAAAGDIAAALEYGKDADARAGALAEANPTRDDVWRESLLCRQAYGSLLQQAGDLKGALKRFEEAMAGYRKLAERPTHSIQPRLDLKNGYLVLSEARERAGDQDTALNDARQAMKIVEQLRAEAPSDTIVFSEEINARRWLAGVEQRASNLDAALREAETALNNARNPAVNLVAREVTIAAALQTRAPIRSQLGDIRAAIDDFESAIAIYARLHEGQPDAAVYTQQLTNCRIELAELKAQAGDVGEANALLDGCVAAADGLVTLHPHAADLKRSAAWVRYRVGQRMRVGGDAQGAVAALRDAFSRYQALAEADRADASDRAMAAWAGIALSHALQTTGDMAQSEAAAKTAAALAEELAVADPLNAGSQLLQANALEAVGYVCGAKGDLLEQARMFERVLKIYAELARRPGSGPAAARNHATGHLLVGQTLLHLGRTAEGRDKLSKALTLRERVAASFGGWEGQIDLINAHLALASSFDEPGLADEGLAHVGKAEDIATRLMQTLPELAASQTAMAATLHQRGDLLLTAERYVEAEAAYRQSLTIRCKLQRLDKANADLTERIAGDNACIAECRFLNGDRAAAQKGFADAGDSYRSILQSGRNDHWVAWNALWPQFRLAQIEGDRTGQLEAARTLRELQKSGGRDRVGKHYGWLIDIRRLFKELDS